MSACAEMLISDLELAALAREGRVARLDELPPLRIDRRRLEALRAHVARKATRGRTR